MDLLAFQDKIPPTMKMIHARPINQFVMHIIYGRHWDVMVNIAKPSDIAIAKTDARKAADAWNKCHDRIHASLHIQGKAAYPGNASRIKLTPALLEVPSVLLEVPSALQTHLQVVQQQQAPTAMSTKEANERRAKSEEEKKIKAAASKTKAAASLVLAEAAVGELDAQGMCNNQEDAHAKMRAAVIDAATSLWDAMWDRLGLGEHEAEVHQKMVAIQAKLLDRASPPTLFPSHNNVSTGDHVVLQKLRIAMGEYNGQKGVVTRIRRHGEGAKYMYEVALEGDASFNARLKIMNVKCSMKSANKERIAENPHHIVVKWSQIAKIMQMDASNGASADRK